MTKEEKVLARWWLRAGVVIGALFTCLFGTALRLHEADHDGWAAGFAFVAVVLALLTSGTFADEDEGGPPAPPSTGDPEWGR